MDSWWRLGEGMGQRGGELAVHQITCAFCLERGNFRVEHHAELKKPNGTKRLNFDTLQCGRCTAYVLVLWSASEHFVRQGLHDYRVLPWPLTFEESPEHWPQAVGRFWLQAQRSLQSANWDAAAVMARSALQATLRDKQAIGANLKQEIHDLAAKGLLPPVMKDWSDNVRELGNDAAHPTADRPPTSPQDARDVVEFLTFLLECLYDLPDRIDKYRQRRTNESS